MTPSTKAILAVHYGGQAAAWLSPRPGRRCRGDPARGRSRGARRHVPGTSGGGFGRAAMFSFTPTKNITTGEGGMVTTDDSELAQRLRLLRDHGQTGLYEHRVLGYNWRLSDIQAAIGSAQVAKLPAILRRTRDGRPADRRPDRRGWCAPARHPTGP